MLDSNRTPIFATQDEAIARSDRAGGQPAPQRDSRRGNGVHAATNASLAAKVGRWFTRILALLAVLSSAALLAAGAIPLLKEGSVYGTIEQIRVFAARMVSPFAASALILAGTSFIGLQALLRPGPLELLKRFLLGLAFVLWGVTALMPPGALTTELGNLVIALYVIDLGLMIRGDLKHDAEASD